MDSTAGKLLAHAFSVALAAFLFGLCLGSSLIQQPAGLYVGGVVISGALLLFAFYRVYRSIRRFTPANRIPSEAAMASARQFLLSCVFFGMISATFGLTVSGFIWNTADFTRTFSVICFSAFTCIAIFPVRRDAKRLASAVVRS